MGKTKAIVIKNINVAVDQRMAQDLELLTEALDTTQTGAIRYAIHALAVSYALYGAAETAPVQPVEAV